MSTVILVWVVSNEIFAKFVWFGVSTVVSTNPIVMKVLLLEPSGSVIEFPAGTRSKVLTLLWPIS